MNEGIFSGSDYSPVLDDGRLRNQIDRVRMCMSDGRWRTLSEIAAKTGDPEASVSAQMRNLRKLEFGSNQILKRTRGDREKGLFEYLMVVPPKINYDENGQASFA